MIDELPNPLGIIPMFLHDIDFAILRWDVQILAYVKND